MLTLTLAFIGLQQPALPVVIPEAVAKAHQEKASFAWIPPIAKLAKQTGTCHVQIYVDVTGKVTSAITLDGPPMLQGAAAEYARTLHFRPFEQGGQVVDTTTVLAVSYGPASPLPPEEGSAEPQQVRDERASCYLPQLKKTDSAQTASACVAVAEYTTEHPEVAWDEPRSDAVRASRTLLAANCSGEALKWSGSALAAAEKSRPDDATLAETYLVRAQAELVTQDIPGASKHLDMAESLWRQAIATIQSDPRRKAYALQLKAVLQLHAKVLTALHDNSGAAAKSAEAATLS